MILNIAAVSFSVIGATIVVIVGANIDSRTLKPSEITTQPVKAQTASPQYRSSAETACARVLTGRKTHPNFPVELDNCRRIMGLS